MADVKIKVLKNGPFLVDGDVEIRDHDGNLVPVAKKPVALCRCAVSAKKPFCDGAHTKVAAV